MSILPPEALAALKDDVTGILEEQAQSLLQGAAGDVKNYVVAIATDMTRALMLPTQERREALLRELRAQLRALAEINRIRAEQAAWETFERVVSVAAGVALQTAVRSVPGV